MKTGVYSITNLVNGKMIIGSGILNSRKNRHLNELRKNIHPNPHLQASYNIYGPENFIWEVIEECDHYLCLDLETYWITILGTKDKRRGYNINDPKRGRLGLKLSQETKDKISKALIGNKYALGYKHTEETLEKISKSSTNRFFSKETRDKISKANSGKVRTEEMKKNISRKNKGKQSRLGAIISKEQREKASKSMSKPILQFSLTNDFIQEWESIKTAQNTLGITNISAAISGKYLQAGGFKWKKKNKLNNY